MSVKSGAQYRQPILFGHQSLDAKEMEIATSA